eukprot:Hpha_TRINITY_DN16776_c4_g1::TRINITY_DN16776_c4_g1_i1::g.76469::m.76469
MSGVSLTKAGPDSLQTGRFAGRFALVTGGAGGIGEAVCKALTAEGASVVVIGRNGAQARKVASNMPGGYSAQVDISNSKEVKSLFQSIRETFGRLDFVVNNAGITGEQVPTHEHPDENWHNVINTNLTGAFYILRAGLALMKSVGKGGVIVNISSICGMAGH